MSNRRPYTPDRVALFGPQTINLLEAGNAVLVRLNDQDTRFIVQDVILETVYAKGTTATDPQVRATDGTSAITTTLTITDALDNVGGANYLALVANPVPVVSGTDTLTLEKVVVGAGQATATRERTNGVATIVTGAAHGFTTGDLITISSMTDSTFNAVDACVTVVNSTTFTYANAGVDVVSGADTAGRVGALKVNAYAIGIYW
jgi:hypothetical protein